MTDRMIKPSDLSSNHLKELSFIGHAFAPSVKPAKGAKAFLGRVFHQLNCGFSKLDHFIATLSWDCREVRVLKKVSVIVQNAEKNLAKEMEVRENGFKGLVSGKEDENLWWSRSFLIKSGFEEIFDKSLYLSCVNTHHIHCKKYANLQDKEYDQPIKNIEQSVNRVFQAILMNCPKEGKKRDAVEAEIQKTAGIFSNVSDKLRNAAQLTEAYKAKLDERYNEGNLGDTTAFEESFKMKINAFREGRVA